jgi:hypothetical protein
MADALDSKSSPSNRVSVQVRSPVLLKTKGLTVISRESFLAFKKPRVLQKFYIFLFVTIFQRLAKHLGEKLRSLSLLLRPEPLPDG